MSTLISALRHMVLFTFLSMIFIVCKSAAQTPVGTYNVILLGNLADVKDQQPFYKAFKTHIDTLDLPFALIINGDFLGEEGSHELDYLHYFAKLIEKRPECRIIIVQGDRDWDNSSPDGWKRIKEVKKKVENWSIPNLFWIGGKGCPGPEILTLDNHLQLIGINTQWFNHPFDKPTIKNTDCAFATNDAFFEELDVLLDDHTGQNVLIVGHAPLRSNGPYGGRFKIGSWIFPIPVVSGFMTAYRQNVGTSMEINNKYYAPFKEKMLDLILEDQSLIYASSHEKIIEVLRHGANYLINSGSTGEHSYAKNSRFTQFRQSSRGFTELEYRPDGDIILQTFRFERGNLKLGERKKLYQAPCEMPARDIQINGRFIPCALETPVLDQMYLSHPDSVVVEGFMRYRISSFSRKFMGEHYRRSWSTPIKAGVLNLDTMAGGLIPYSLGTGRKTKSLLFSANNGKEYVFRSTAKNAAKALKYDLRNTIADLLLQDQTSSQYPYAGLMVADLMDHIDLLHTKPKLCVLPDDPKLGPFRYSFGGMLGTLEPRVSDEAARLLGYENLVGSINMIRAKYGSYKTDVDRNEYLRARIFDILIGDWNKNEYKWKWVAAKEKDGITYHPVPMDRDQAFSRWDGFFPWLADREWFRDAGEDFNYEIKGLKSLVYESRHLDRFLLNSLTKDDWLQQCKFIKSRLSSDIINGSIQSLPAELRSKEPEVIADKLVARINDIEKYASEYYAMLAKDPDIVGTNEDDHFKLFRTENGGLEISVSPLSSGTSKPYFYRAFLPEETKEVRLFGLEGDDVFTIEGKADKSILVRLIPGSGSDSVYDQSDVKCGTKRTKLYINKFEHCALLGSKETKLIKHADEIAYNYDRLFFDYPSYFPYIYLFYDSDRGLDATGVVTFTRQKYGKKDFSSKHTFRLRLSSDGNMLALYNPVWRHVIRSWDLSANVYVEKNKNFNYYFGKGFEGNYNDSLFKRSYYSLDYTSWGAGIGLTRDFWTNAKATFGISVFKNSEQRNSNSIATIDPDIYGQEKNITAKLSGEIDLDITDDKYLPMMGYRFYTSFKAGSDFQTEGGSFSSAFAFAEHYVSFHPITLHARVGGGYNDGKVPYFELFYLGRKTFLQGYRQNRFLGDRALFANTEMRVQLFNRKTRLIPLQFGLTIFADAGHIYLNDSESTENKWHLGYGAGFYLVPYKKRYTLRVSAAFSEEESGIIQVSLGQKF